MGKFKTVDCGSASKRIFEGSIRICSTSNSEIYGVRLELLNGKKNRNNWVYENIERHLEDFAGKPILYAVVGSKIGDGHNFEIVKDKQTGEEYASFIGATSERIGGYIEKELTRGVLNPHIENIDGTDWVVANGSLWRWYNKELVDEIEKNGGLMKVSIETLVTKNRIVNGVEYEEEYKILGVTILGTGVTEAVAGANIRKLSASMGELEQLKIRAASYMQIDNNEPQTQKQKKSEKGVTRTMAKKMHIDDLRSKFDGYTVLGVNGLNVALLNQSNGRCCTYPFGENEDTVLPERIAEVSVNCAFGEGDAAVDVPIEQIIGSVQAQLNSTKSALDEATKENAELKAKVNDMTAAERKRRVKLVKDAIKAELAENREAYKDDAELDEHLCDELLTDECVGKYAEMVNAEGEFIGDAKARDDVNAKCNKVVRDAKKEKAKNNAAKHKYAWENGGMGDEGAPEGSGSTAIENILKD